MKSTAKVFTIIGGILVGGGLILAILGASFGAFSSNKKALMGDYIKETKSFNVSEVSSIKTNLDNRRVKVISTNGNKINMTYYTGESDPIICNKKSKDIVLESEYNGDWFHFIFDFDFIFFHFSSDYNEVLIEIPSSYADDLILETSNACIEISDFESISKLECKTSNGHIDAKNINCKNGYFKSSNNRIELTDVISQTTIIADTSNGGVNLNSCEADEMELDSSNNHIELIDVVSKKSITATSSNGRIELENLASDDIYLKSSNGRIEGTIKGNEDEYNITSQTSNSNSSLPNDRDGSTNKKLNVKTSNGKIEVDFVK